MGDNIGACDVAYVFRLPDGLPEVHGFEGRGRRLVVSQRALRIEHWPAHDSPGALHVFIDGARVRADGTLGSDKAVAFSDEPDRWADTVRHTHELPAWSRPYIDAVRIWETGRGNSRPSHLSLL